MAYVSAGLILLALFSIHVPEGGSLLLLPALLLVYIQRNTLHIESDIVVIGIVFVIYVLFFTFVSADSVRSAKGAYDIFRGLFAFFPALWLGRRLELMSTKSIGLFIGLSFVLVNFAFPGLNGEQAFYGFHSNPNNVAVTLTAYLFLIFALYPTSNGDSGVWYFLLVFAAICVALFLLMLANSRGSWLGVAIAFLLITLIQQNIGRHIKVVVAFTVCVGLMTLVALADVKGFGYGTVGARLDIWSGLSALVIPDHLWFGYGVNYVKDVMMAAKLPTLTAHNIFLEIFVSTGLIGFSIFLYIVYRLFSIMLKHRYTEGPVLNAGIGGLVAFLIMGQFDLKFASFTFIATVSCFLGLIYSQRELTMYSTSQD